MSTDSQKHDPILPFDITYGERTTIYRQMKYKHDRDLCEKTGITKESGNICKYYNTKDAEPVKIIENQQSKKK